MVDFLKLGQHFLDDVYKESNHTYKSSKKFLRRIRTAPAREDGDQDPRLRIVASACAEKCFCVKQKLAERRRSALIIVDGLVAQEKDLLDKEEAFQKRFIEFNEQVILNSEKRERAFIRLQEFRRLKKAHEDNIQGLLSRVLKLRQYKDEVLKETKKHLIYEEFMESILYDFGAKASVYDVVTRYRNLDSKKRYLNKKNVAMNEALKRMYQDSWNLIGAHHETVINLINQSYRAVVRYEQAMQRTSQLEGLVTSLWECCSEKLTDLVLAVQGIQNLNGLMQKRRLMKSAGGHQELLDMSRVIQDVVTIKNTMRGLVRVMEKLESQVEGIKRERTLKDHGI